MGNEDTQPQTQTVLKLSFSEDQSFSKAADEQSSQESTPAEASNMKETVEVSRVSEQGRSEVFSFDEVDASSYSEEAIEPSTDEEFRSWRYPQDKVCREEGSVIAEEQGEENEGEEKEKRGSVADHSEPSDMQDGECLIAGSSELQDDEKLRPEKVEEDITEDIDIFPIKQDQKDTEGCSHDDDDDVESERRSPDSRVKETGYTELEINIEDVAKAEIESSDIDRAQSFNEVQVSDHLLEDEEMEQDAVNERQGVTEETHKAEGGESSKKVTFILEPELINDSTLSEASTSMESRAETPSVSGENRCE